MTLRAIVHSAEEGGFWAEVPALPGCATQGETLEEIRANLKEAVELWLEAGASENPVGSGDQIVEFAV
jgi:predicted RNase H-like HicB family nuclease